MSLAEFDTLSDYQTAIDALIAEAQWRLRFYDATLEQGGFNAAARYERLRAFCLGGGGQRGLKYYSTIQSICKHNARA